MRLLALLGTTVLLAGCPTTHATVRSCVEAADAPDGTACDGFASCPVVGCAMRVSCTAGSVLRTMTFDCDGGTMTLDSGHDVDAGPCAPQPPPSGVGCHVTSDCDPTHFEMCFAPGASRGCGPCVMATRTCATDADCAATDYCRSYVNPCSAPGSCGNGSDVTSTECVPRCTATSCGAGATCDPSGRCTPDPCAGGAYTCPTNTHCGGSGASDPHGCVRDACSFDSDCACGGACLSGSCFDTLGTCSAPAA